MITHLWYTNECIHTTRLCVRATLLPPCEANRTTSISFFSPFPSWLRHDLIHGRSSRINRFTVHSIPLSKRSFVYRERGNRREDYASNERHASLLTRLFICIVLFVQTERVENWFFTFQDATKNGSRSPFGIHVDWLIYWKGSTAHALRACAVYRGETIAFGVYSRRTWNEWRNDIYIMR